MFYLENNMSCYSTYLRFDWLNLHLFVISQYFLIWYVQSHKLQKWREDNLLQKYTFYI